VFAVFPLSAFLHTFTGRGIYGAFLEMSPLRPLGLTAMASPARRKGHTVMNGHTAMSDKLRVLDDFQTTRKHDETVLFNCANPFTANRHQASSRVANLLNLKRRTCGQIWASYCKGDSEALRGKRLSWT